MMKKMLALLLCVLFAVTGIVGCSANPALSDSSSADTPPAASQAPVQDTTQEVKEVDQSIEYEDEVIIGSEWEIEFPNAYLGSQIAMNQSAELLYSRLVNVDKLTRELIPDAAIEWSDVSPEGNYTVWEFKLRQGMTFHNGNPLTAEDIAYSWDVAHNAELAPNTMSVSTVFEVEIVDDYTVRFHMSSPDVDFAKNVRLMFIVDKETCEAEGFENGGVIGSGPYMFEERQIGVQYSYVKFEDYYAADKYPTKRIVVKYIPDASTRLVALQTGEIDVMSSVNADAYNTIAADSNLQLVSRKGNNEYIIFFCFAKENELSDLRVRQAFYHALNREEIVEICFQNLGEVWGGHASPAIEYSVEPNQIYEYNPEKAKELLAEAGYGPGNPLTTRFIHFGGIFSEICAVVQAQLAAVGVTVNVEQVDNTTFNTLLRTDTPPMYCSYNGSTVTDIFTSIYSKGYRTGSGFNHHHPGDPEFDALLDKAQAAISTEERTQYAAELGQYLYDNCIGYPIAVGYNIYAAQKDVEGLIVDVSIPTMNYATIRIPKRP